MHPSQTTHTLKRGARLRYPVRDHRGVLLLAQGAEVTDRLHTLLQLRGINLDVQACLKVTGGGPIGQEIPICKNQTTIGRRPDCDVQLTSPVVSGHHCRVTKQAFEVVLEDLGSRNGTYLNEQPVLEKVELSDQDRIGVGGTVFTIQMFAAFRADTEEGNQAVNAWILDGSGNGRSAFSPYTRTAHDVDLDSLR